MIQFDAVGVRYPGQPALSPALQDTTFEVEEGELVPGRSGAPASGKSTLLRASTGWCPTSPAARSPGACRVDGRDTRTHPPRELADVVGVVGQDPLAGFVTDTVEDELAYGMETARRRPPAVMRRRVEETLDLLGLAELRHAIHCATLSGGPAAAGRDRRGAGRRTPRPRPRRADLALWIPPPPKRCSPRCPPRP